MNTCISRDDADFFGRILVRTLPAMSRQEWEAWWPRTSERERDRYTSLEVKNIITLNGRIQALTYVGSVSSNSVAAWSQYFAVGTGSIVAVLPADTLLVGEIQRVVPSSFTVTGNICDISSFFGTSQGNGTWTNGGIFGVSATSTVNSGVMMTHALLNGYVKTNLITVTVDYLISLN